MEIVPQLLANGVIAGGTYALVAVGYTMVYGVLKFINFAHGDVGMIGAYTAWALATWAGWPVPLAVAAAMAAGALLGVGLDAAAYRPLRRAPRLAPLISAIALSLALQSVALLAFGADIRSYRRPVVPALEFAGVFVTPIQIVILATGLVAMALLFLLLTRTTLGKAIRATADNPTVARIVGIDTNRAIAAVFAVGSALAALGVALAGLESNLQPTMGVTLGIKAFAAVVVGGIGSVPGAVVGGFVIGVAENLGSFLLQPVWKDSIAYAILALALLFRPSGLFGVAAEAETKL